MTKLFMFLGAFALTIGMSLGVIWLIWILYCWVVPQLWPAGPQNIVAPGFWLFAGVWWLGAIVARLVFPSRRTTA